MKTRNTALLALAAVSTLALTGCAGRPAASPTTPPTTPPAENATLTVFAAASLSDTFEEIGARFEQGNPGVRVRFAFAGSSDLVQQITAGAPADVFASADEANMQKALDAGAVAGEPRAFATNVLTLVTPPDNPADITSLQDAAAEGVDLVVCAPQVPCGNAAVILAEDTGVELNPVSEESAVTDVLGKVTSGEADAGLVYVTDAAGAGEAVHTVGLDNADAAVNTYPIAALENSEQQDVARSFVDHVLSEDGQSLLQEYGFGAP